jgi:hypothetical protein
MKTKLAFLVVAAAGVAAALAFAAPGRTDGGTTTATTTSATTTSDPGEHHCHAVEVAGTIASVSASSLTVNVQRANAEGAAYVGKTATFAVGPRTRVLWDGAGTFTGPNQGDRVAAAASCDAPAGSAMTAARVIARSPRPAGGDSHTPRR